MEYNTEIEKEVEKLSGSVKFDTKFLEQRKVFLWGAVHDESAEKIVNRLLFLESEKPGEPITLFVNSPGGSVTSGLVIIDVMKMISSPVNTVCMGLAASMGAMILSFGKKKSIFENGRVMIHQPSISSISGQASDMEITANQILKTREMLAEMLAANCKQPIEKIRKDFDRDYWMDAKESKEYGIVDEIYSKF
ncbi:MAG: ATP-dependent Clp protease proteolytic subunit [Chitinophagales bacterium]|nr:ATP-dependent Clp protease proteolytic subunit [Chitinophagales bacterium]